MNNKKIECAMQFQNTMNVKGIAVGQSMKEIKKEVEYKNKKVHMVLQFPEATDRTAQIEKEVKEIMKEELHKQIKKRKGVIYYEESSDVIESKF